MDAFDNTPQCQEDGRYANQSPESQISSTRSSKSNFMASYLSDSDVRIYRGSIRRDEEANVLVISNAGYAKICTIKSQCPSSAPF
jgi:hypothetical protein